MDSPAIRSSLLRDRPWVSAREGPPFLPPSRCGLKSGLPGEDGSLPVTIADNEIQVGANLTIAFECTLRLPEDGVEYVVPSGLAPLALHRIDDLADRVPAAWKRCPGAVIPLHPWEAMWICFSSRSWRPSAIKVRVGSTNGLTGRRDQPGLSARPQDYLVCPQEPWLDRVHLGRRGLRQLVAPTYSGRISSTHLQIAVFEPRAGRFSDDEFSDIGPAAHLLRQSGGRAPRSLCLGARPPASSWIEEHVYGIESWDQDSAALLDVHIVDAAWFRHLTGRVPAPSLISRCEYEASGIPWPEPGRDHERQR